MTDRQLQILAAWWHAKGDCKKAALLLGIGHQPVMNALYLMRRQQGAKTTLELAVNKMDEILGVDLISVRRAA